MLRQKKPWRCPAKLRFFHLQPYPIHLSLFVSPNAKVATSSCTESFRDRPWVWVASCSWERQNAQTVKNWKLIFRLQSESPPSRQPHMYTAMWCMSCGLSRLVLSHVWVFFSFFHQVQGATGQSHSANWPHAGLNFKLRPLCYYVLPVRNLFVLFLLVLLALRASTGVNKVLLFFNFLYIMVYSVYSPFIKVLPTLFVLL